FGVGFLEVGPVTLAGGAGPAPLGRCADRQAIWRPEPPASLPLAEATAAVREARATGIPPVVRGGAGPAATAEQALADPGHLVGQLARGGGVRVLAAPAEDGVSPEAWRERLRHALAAVRATATPRPLLLAVPVDRDEADIERLVGPAIEEGISGLLLDASLRAEPAGRVY